MTAKRVRAGFLGGKGGMRQMTLFGSGPTLGWMLMMLMILTDFNLSQSQDDENRQRWFDPDMSIPPPVGDGGGLKFGVGKA